MNAPVVAIVIDLVRSRSHEDRRTLQRAVVDALDRVNSHVPARMPLAPSYADEFQGLYDDTRSALLATSLVRLHLPDGIECRFGIGVGDSTVVDDEDGRTILDGSAWWSARAAIDTAKRREDDDLPWLRTWFEVGAGHEGAAGVPDALITNAYLLCRDELLSQLQPGARRAVLGRQLGLTQEQIAADLGVTQSTVSRTLSRSGAAAVSASTALFGGTA